MNVCIKSLLSEFDQDTKIEMDQWLHWFDERQISMLDDAEDDDDDDYNEFCLPTKSGKKIKTTVSKI